MMEDLLKDGYDYEEYTENIMMEKGGCCQNNGDEKSTSCGCQQKGIPISK